MGHEDDLIKLIDQKNSLESQLDQLLDSNFSKKEIDKKIEQQYIDEINLKEDEIIKI